MIFRHFKALPMPQQALLLMTVAMTVSFQVWSVLLNNFAIESVGFDGKQIGRLHSIREIPGFLAFTVVLVIAMIKEQRLAIVALMLLGIATAITGYWPTEMGLYCTTVISSIGFHYYETLNQSLGLQWVSKDKSSEFFGRQLAVAAGAGIFSYAAVFALDRLTDIGYRNIYLASGISCVAITLWVYFKYPIFKQKTTQHSHLFMRRRYWLYYLLTFLAGARRQIFTVFAGFLMVEKFGFSAAQIALLFLTNAAINLLFGAPIGRWISRVGERRALIIEYLGLILVFAAYALVEVAWIAAILYLLDHLLFAMAIALKSYLKKIADPSDLAGTASVSFTINHIAAVILPALLGILWLHSPSMVFWVGSAIAVMSWIAALGIPHQVDENRNVAFSWLSINKPKP